MKIKMILFDLDGTLLPMDQKTFMKDYFGRLAKHLAPYGYEAEKLIATIWSSTEAMVKNDGSKTNEDAFWERFSEIYKKDARQDIPLFDKFYREEFDKVQPSCGYTHKAALTVKKLKDKGYRVALATNPLFPSMATESRIRWSGLSPDDFELYTTYENASYCKPNPDYYRDIVKRLGVSPEECMMIGNDVEEDMIAQTLGMKVFLLTDCLINKEGKDISEYTHGRFDELLEYIDRYL